jgi:hypothetical protein
MRQKTKNNRNQGSNAKKNFFWVLFPSPLPRWVRLVQKIRAKNSHAWAPLNDPEFFLYIYSKLLKADQARLKLRNLGAGCTVRKMDLILRSIEWMLNIQFFMACNFKLQPLCRYDVKPPENTSQT